MRFGICLMLAITVVSQPAWAAPKKGEPINLFNGNNLEGWTFFLNDKKADAKDVWRVEDGVLVCAGNPTGYLKTKETYRNYVLELEWRFTPQKGPGNSGVLLRQIGADKVWPKSIEAQLMHKNAGDFWNIGKFGMQADPKRTEGRRTKKAQPSNEKPLGQWNKYVITVDGDTVTLKVNGQVQNVATKCDEVAGTIGLQSEGAEIHFRNIRLTPLE